MKKRRGSGVYMYIHEHSDEFFRSKSPKITRSHLPLNSDLILISLKINMSPPSQISPQISQQISQLKIYNTLSKQKEIFQPIDPHGKDVGAYVCGNTVYDFCHIGNARVFVFFDVVTRYLRTLGYNVTFVRNITDIDDKIINRARDEHTDHTIITARFIQALHEDLQKLGIAAPTHEPQVTAHLPQICALIQTLLDKNYAYIASNGDVYYDTTKFKAYGELAQQSLDSLRSGARVDISAVKRNALDFVLWKMAKVDEPSWQSPWGNGRPGWHIECSAMAQHYLGAYFDIHGGGADLQFPHHQNEVAQSEAASGCKFVKYWMHVGFVSINNEKMSKSLGNFFTVREVLQHYHPEVLRFFLLMAHYRSPLNYSLNMLDAARESLTTLYTAMRKINLENAPKHVMHVVDAVTQLTLLTSPTENNVENNAQNKIKNLAENIEENAEESMRKNAATNKTNGSINESIIKIARNLWLNFITALNDDFNIPLALSYVFELARKINSITFPPTFPVELATLAEQQMLAIVLRDKMCAMLGILRCNPEEFFQTGIADAEKDSIQQLIDARKEARCNKDWTKADAIRTQLDNLGIILEDSLTGTSWKKKVDVS